MSDREPLRHQLAYRSDSSLPPLPYFLCYRERDFPVISSRIIYVHRRHLHSMSAVLFVTVVGLNSCFRWPGTKHIFHQKQLSNYSLDCKCKSWMNRIARTSLWIYSHKGIQQRSTTCVSPWLILHLACSFNHFLLFCFVSSSAANIERLLLSFYTISRNSEAVEFPYASSFLLV